MPQGGIAAYLLGLLESPLAVDFELRAVDVTVPPFFQRHRAARPLLAAVFLARLEAALARFEPDLVHVHTSDHAGFWEKSLLAAAARARRLPVVLHLHGGSFDRFLRELSPRRARAAARSLSAASRVVVLSQAWRPLVAGFAAPERVVVLPNAIRWGEFEPAAARETHLVPRLLFMGMISPRKGLDELLQALLELRSGGVPFEAEIVGGEEFPNERARFESLFRAAGLGDATRFAGPLYGEAKLDALRRADVFVLPSRSESFGIANLEAMAAALPVVSTRTGAIPEYVSDGVTGLLVDPGDSAGLATALGRLLRDPALCRRLGEAGRVRARDFDWSVAAGRLGALYREVLAERRASSPASGGMASA